MSHLEGGTGDRKLVCGRLEFLNILPISPVQLQLICQFSINLQFNFEDAAVVFATNSLKKKCIIIIRLPVKAKKPPDNADTGYISDNIQYPVHP